MTSAITTHAHARPNQPSLAFESHELTYAALETLIEQLAAWLQAQVGFGSKIALCLPNSPSLAVLFLAGVRAGCEVQIFDHEWPQATARALLDNLSPELFITDSLAISTPRSMVLEQPFAAFDTIDSRLGVPAFQSPQQRPSSKMAFYTGFTSGSTGRPKGFRRDHDSWLASFKHDQTECPLHPQDTVIAPGALSHSLFLYAMIHALHAGAKVVFCRRFSARNVARIVKQHRASVLYTVPAKLETLVRVPNGYGSSLSRVLSSGAKLNSRLRERFHQQFSDTELCEFYGASELSFVAIANSSEAIPADSVGRAFSGVTLSIRDENGQRLPPGQVGRVFVASDMTFLGYAQEHQDDLLRLDTAMSVGDLGVLDENGHLFLRGRADRMIVSSGKNVYPEEIEDVLLNHPAVKAAAVIGVTDEKRGKRLAGIIQWEAAQDISRSQLMEYCRKHLPQYKVPRLFSVCHHWYETRSGKTDFAAVQNAWQHGDVTELK